MADDVMELYFGSKADPSPKTEGSVMDMYFPKTEEVAAPQTNEFISDLQKIRNKELPSQPATSLPVAVGKDYLSNMGKTARGGIETIASGFEDIGEKKTATGVGKVGLGSMQYMLSPFSAGVETAIEKPAAGVGGKEFGEKAGMLATSGLPIMKAGQSIVKAMPTNKALSSIIERISPDQLSAGLVRLKENPDLTVMDVFPSIRMMGQKLITTEGQHQDRFEKFITDRVTGRKNAVENIYTDALGPPPNVLIKLNQLKQNIKDSGKPITPIIENAGPVDLTNVISNIDAKLKPGITSVISAGEPLPLGDIEKPLANLRKFITDDKSMRTDAKSIHQFQSVLRSQADDLLNSASGKDRQLGYALMNVRNQVVDAIDIAAGGKYKPQLAKYRDENQVQDAFNKGNLITKNRPGQWDDRPEFWEEWVKNASKAELEAAREGAKVAIDQQINGFRGNGRKGMDIPDVEFNRDKLRLLFSNKDVDTMFKRLSDQREISDTDSKMISGSQTAMRMKVDSAVDLPIHKSVKEMAIPAAIAEAASVVSGGYPGLATGTLITADLTKRHIVDKISTKLAMKKNERLGDLLTSTGPDRDELIRTLEQYLPKPKPSMLQRVHNLALPVLPP